MVDGIEVQEQTHAKKKQKRYRTDRIEFTKEGDGPFLRLIRNATFISHGQLLKMSLQYGFGRYRQSVYWRTKRYLTTELVKRLPRIQPHPGVVYTITRDGLRVLEGYGEGLFSVSSNSQRLANAVQAPHFLEINNVRIALESSKKLTVQNWWTDREIASLNYSLATPYAKDYDGIVEVQVGKRGTVKFGFEYERTCKSEERYGEISAAIAKEKQLKFVLYVTSSPEFAIKLAYTLKCPPMPVCVTTAGAIFENDFDAKVAFMLNNNLEGAPFSVFINALAHSQP